MIWEREEKKCRWSYISHDRREMQWNIHLKHGIHVVPSTASWIMPSNSCGGLRLSPSICTQRHVSSVWKRLCRTRKNVKQYQQSSLLRFQTRQQSTFVRIRYTSRVCPCIRVNAIWSADDTVYTGNSLIPDFVIPTPRWIMKFQKAELETLITNAATC